MFRNINRLFVLSFKNGNDDLTRDSFEKYYMSLVEIKDFSALIDNKPFFDQPVKSKQESCEKHIETNKFIRFVKTDLSDLPDLSKQTSTNIPLQIIFIGKLEENDGATMFFYC